MNMRMSAENPQKQWEWLPLCQK